MMNLQRRAGARLIGLFIVAGLVALVTACGAFTDPYAQPAASTAVPATPAAAVIPPTTAPLSTSVAANTPAAAAATTPATASSPAAATGATSAPSSSDTVHLTLVEGDNEARYRVREQLARISFPSDAVGATKSVTGTINAKLDGTVLPGSLVRVDVRTLKSDETQRDRFIQNDPLQTRTYPFVEFVPTALQGLPLPLQQGAVAFKLVGNLTIRNVTKPVTWDVKGTVTGDEAKGQAITTFNFDYFNLDKPSVFTVLTINDPIQLEIDLHLKRVP